MPDLSDFEVPLPAELQSLTGEEISDENITSVPKPLAPLPNIIHVPDLLKPLDSNVPNTNVEGVQIAHVGRDAGLTGDLQATYLRLPPGTRTTRPVAQRLGDSITYCISGRGLLWQNGWTFPMNTSDAVGWKAGTGITHTIINDSNHDGSSGEDLLLLVAHEVKQDESFSYPLDPEMDETTLSAEGKSLWKDAPVQGEFGPHPGIPSVSNKRGNQYIPEPQKGYRPSNIVNAIAELDSIGDGDMFANATSLSQETGLSGRFGCNFEVPPPGARSSDPHAHSLEDELVYIVSGTGLVWLNGHVHPVREGDAVGFPGGTGIAHNFINDSNANGEEGEPLILWIIGQNKSKIGDMVYYPLHTAKENKFKRWWAGEPFKRNSRPLPFTYNLDLRLSQV
ncbi:hypothetical protein K439DRAFT_1349715 [Ramaria rubella]|nr:hypothetical protein K439DRAFT_1349715 [Ramaria rubella]